MARRFAGERLVIATHNPGKLARDRGAAARRSASTRVGAGALACPSPRRPAPRSRPMPSSRRAPRPRRAGCRRWPTIAAWWCRRWAARPASIPRAGPGRSKDFARPWRGSSASSAARRPPRPFRLRAGARLARRPCRDASAARCMGSWSFRRAARAASATTRSSCRTAAPRPSARWIRGRSTRISHRAARLRQLVAALLCARRRVSRRGALALYIHWPFCNRNAPIATSTAMCASASTRRAGARALIAELDHAAAAPARPARCVSIFFGGGTPSLMAPATVGGVARARGRAAGRSRRGLEITLEANPTSVEAARFADFRAAGVNRVSLGVQALDDAALSFLGRGHDAAEALAGGGARRARFSRASPSISSTRGRARRVAAWRDELDGRWRWPAIISRSISSPSSPAPPSRRPARAAISRCPTRSCRARSTRRRRTRLARGRACRL